MKPKEPKKLIDQLEEKYAILLEISDLLKCKPEQVMDKIDKLVDEVETLRELHEEFKGRV